MRADGVCACLDVVYVHVMRMVLDVRVKEGCAAHCKEAHARSTTATHVMLGGWCARFTRRTGNSVRVSHSVENGVRDSFVQVMRPCTR